MASFPIRPLLTRQTSYFTLHHKEAHQDVLALKKTSNAPFAIAAFKTPSDASRVACRLDTQYQHTGSFPSFVLRHNVLNTEATRPFVVEPTNVSVKEWFDLNNLLAYSTASNMLLMVVTSVHFTKQDKLILYSDFIKYQPKPELYSMIFDHIYDNF
jgi:hypothetical protein